MPGENSQRRAFAAPPAAGFSVEEACAPAALDALLAGISLELANTARIVMLPVVEFT
jgi:hypothetical protein